MKQIVGGSLKDSGAGLRTNFVSERPAKWFAELYRKDDLRGAHVIMLGPGNEAAGREALGAWPGGMQIGGGVNGENARGWLEAGASHVIITSWVLREGQVEWERLRELNSKIGKAQLVLDLSCRKRDGKYFVVTDRWQKFTEMEVNRETLETLAKYCDEFLVHAVDVEGLCEGIDVKMVQDLAAWSPIVSTYAGGARSLDDLKTVTRLGKGRVHLTIGSALDIFGGTGVRYAEAVAFNHGAGGDKRLIGEIPP